MPRHPVFTPQDISVFRRAIDTYRAPGAYEPGKWSVSPLHRRPEIVGTFPRPMVLRDIAVRTTEPMPGVVLPAAERRRLLQAVVEAGVPSVQVGAFGRSRSRADMRADVVRIKAINPQCEVVYGGLTSVAHDPYTMLDKLQGLGKQVELAHVEPILGRVKDEMQRLRRVLTDDEVRAIAEAVERERMRA